MSRRNRFAPPNHWLHITQRGNDKQRIFLTDPDRQTFLQLLEQRSEERQVHIAAYAVMSNHFHLVAKGDRDDAISLFMMDVNGLYATYRNKTHRHSGRVWQGRFYAAVLDHAHFATALRYVELNPVRARLVERAGDFPWSSAPAHLGLIPPPAWLHLEDFRQRWPTAHQWQQSLGLLSRREAAALRLATRHDTALGSDDFVQQLEQQFAIQLRAKPLNRPRKLPPKVTTTFGAPAAALHA